MQRAQTEGQAGSMHPRQHASLTEVRAACTFASLCMCLLLSACLLPAQLDVKYNYLGDESKAAIKEAVRDKEGFKLQI